MTKFGIAAISLLSFASVVAAQPATEKSATEKSVKVKIDSGALVGSTENGVDVFKGVPFAKPPLGALRWHAPVKPTPWQGERDATKFSLPCPQPINADGKSNGGGVSGAYSEDCLYLNVWAPAHAKHAPIMLWLFGGGSFLGAGHLGTFDGSYFARDGVIVVTINYRLGSLGMFAHPAITKAAKPNDALGNYALLDAMAALRWVQRNGAAFGGDTKNVTLFGQSAGGVMTVAMLSIPSSKGLYQKAIVESGALLRGGPKLAEAEAIGAKDATALGLRGANATLAQLRAVPAKKLVETEATRRGIFGILDGRLRKESPEEAFKSGTAIDVPLIIGSNSGEPGADAARAVAAYEASGAPSYLYQFNYVPEWRKAEQPHGAIHSSEIVYVFDSWKTSVFGGPKVTAHEHAVSDLMHSCWVAFAKEPASARTLKCANGFSWPSYTKANDAISVFSEHTKVEKAADIPAFVPPPKAK